jgi:hypothetical protein
MNLPSAPLHLRAPIGNLTALPGGRKAHIWDHWYTQLSLLRLHILIPSLEDAVSVWSSFLLQKLLLHSFEGHCYPGLYSLLSVI